MFQYQVVSSSSADRESYLHSFIELYQLIFSGKPFFEKFTDKQITKIYDDYSQDGNMFVLVFAVITDRVDVESVDSKKMIGFSAGKPLQRCDSKMVELLSDKLPIHASFYNADLGVLPAYRGNYIGITMIKQRIDFAVNNHYSYIVMRTSETDSMSSPIYEKLGFKKVEGVYQNVQQQRINNNIDKTDKRVFFAKQVNMIND